MKQWISDYIQAHKTALDSIPQDAVAGLIETLRKALDAGRHIFVFGNGGSAANSSHFVTDLGKGASDKIGRRFRCLSLNDNVSWMTAIGNDYAFEEVFARQVRAFGQGGDILVAFTSSGRSRNITLAIQEAKRLGLRTITFLGKDGGEIAGLSDIELLVPHTRSTARIQEAHQILYHALCEIVDQELGHV